MKTSIYWEKIDFSIQNVATFRINLIHQSKYHDTSIFSYFEKLKNPLNNFLSLWMYDMPNQGGYYRPNPLMYTSYTSYYS